MFDIFGPRLARPARWEPCSSWYGHTFRETRSGEAIYCPTCGQVRPIGKATR